MKRNVGAGEKNPKLFRGKYPFKQVISHISDLESLEYYGAIKDAPISDEAKNHYISQNYTHIIIPKSCSDN